MKKLFLIIFIQFCLVNVYADEIDTLYFNDNEILDKFQQLDDIANNLSKNNLIDNANLNYINQLSINNFYNLYTQEHRMPTFWIVALVSAVGTYTLYGAGVGPIAVAVVYLGTHKDRHETKLAIYGCLTGAAVGGIAKWLSVR
ncbi:MAG: hypothetical protein MJ211_07890 [Bacteroidales bacterium]|nr:hypothetical protein [Bacteroidales bacterium]